MEGTPGLEITIVAPAVARASPAMIVTLVYEPGVHVSNKGEEIWYNPTRFVAKRLGGSVGGGSMYAHDPNVVCNSILDTKKRTLRVQVTTHVFVPGYPAALR
jgi:hypothetical protein